MRVLVLPLLLAVAVTGCRIEPRTEAAPPADAPGATAPALSPAGQTAGAETGERPEVVLYVTEWCPYCKQAREFMAEQDVPHRVVDIEATPEGLQEYQAMGGTGPIPLVAVGTQVIEGWSADIARQMLDTAGYD